MKRKKRHLTAKALTLRLAAVALVMALLPILLGFYNLFPSLAINRYEKEFGSGSLEILASQPLEGQHRAYLTGNEHCLLLLFCRIYPSIGWDGCGVNIIDLSQKEGPVWASTTTHNSHGAIQQEAVYDYYHYGRVDVDSAESVRILFPHGESTAPLELPLILGEDGHRYFWALHKVQWDGWETDFFDIDVEVLDAAGTVLYTYETLPSYTEEELAGTENKGSLSEGAGSAKR